MFPALDCVFVLGFYLLGSETTIMAARWTDMLDKGSKTRKLPCSIAA
jgi:hypothetical protein